MSTQISRLPRRIPAGTRYVIEGRGGFIKSRYIEFPDGRHIDLPADLAARTAARRSASSASSMRRTRKARKLTAKKNVTAGGTTRRFGS